MEPDKDKAPAPEGDEQKQEQDAPADALSRTPDELEEEKAEQVAASGEAKTTEPEKKVSPIRRLFRRLNVYFLIFLLMTVVAIIIVVVNYLNSQKVTPPASIATQNLNQDTLKQLANTDASVGNTSQTLTIQGNAIIAGQTLMRGNLNVAGNFQTGGSITGPSLTISGTSNLGQTQINSLQVAQNTAIQGTTTMRDLNVSGTASFSGPITASQITVTKLILAGNGTLQLPNHLSFTGTSPARSFIGSGLLGSGGSVALNGSDTSGTINMNSGNNPQGSGCIVRVTFAQAFTSQPRVIVSPVGSAAGSMQYYVDRDTKGFSLCTNTPPAANQTFAFDFFVAG